MRIAIVNDLALAREILCRLVLSVPGYEVAWTAENGDEAVEKTLGDRPDIILMDLVMPVMDGVEATRRIMAQSPCPILLVTSSVTGNFNMVYRAMGFGGLDAVNTPSMGPDQTIRDGEGILARIAKLAQALRSPAWSSAGPTRVAARDEGRGTSEDISVLSGPSPLASRPSLPSSRHLPLLISLGASTGGPEALARILATLPAALPASVVMRSWRCP